MYMAGPDPNACISKHKQKMRTNYSNNFVRAKRVSDPLGDEAKARLMGEFYQPASSTTSNDTRVAAGDGSTTSPSLSHLVNRFLQEAEEGGEDLTRSPVSYESDSDGVINSDLSDTVEDILEKNSDPFGETLLAQVSKAIETFSCLILDKSVLSRNVVSYLREIGHNAAMCKTKWNSSGGLTAGTYEFIDVLLTKNNSVNINSSSPSPVRYLIDLDFAGEFEIARPTSQYIKALNSLPRVFVGRSEELKRIVKVMSDAAKRSLKSRELSLPPWRKNRYMQNKWLGPCSRTTCSAPPASHFTAAVGFAVSCRAVGLDDGINGRLCVRIR